MKKCTKCKGKGRIERNAPDDPFILWMRCPSCAGTGKERKKKD